MLLTRGSTAFRQGRARIDAHAALLPALFNHNPIITGSDNKKAFTPMR
jgi:hypothetical protein